MCTSTEISNTPASLEGFIEFHPVIKKKQKKKRKRKQNKTAFSEIQRQEWK